MKIKGKEVDLQTASARIAGLEVELVRQNEVSKFIPASMLFNMAVNAAVYLEFVDIL